MARLTSQLDEMAFGDRCITVVYVLGGGGLLITLVLLGLARLFGA